MRAGNATKKTSGRRGVERKDAERSKFGGRGGWRTNRGGRGRSACKERIEGLRRGGRDEARPKRPAIRLTSIMGVLE